MKLDKNTLTKEQQALEKEFGVSYYITKDKKLWMKTSKKYEEFLIEQEFQGSIKAIKVWYSQDEINTWNTKYIEAKKVISWWTSIILKNLLLKWETEIWLAKKIINKAKQFSTIYYSSEKKKREQLNILSKKKF